LRSLSWVSGPSLKGINYKPSQVLVSIILVFCFTFHLGENTAWAKIWANQITTSSTLNALVISKHASLITDTKEHWKVANSQTSKVSKTPKSTTISSMVANTFCNQAWTKACLTTCTAIATTIKKAMLKFSVSTCWFTSCWLCCNWHFWVGFDQIIFLKKVFLKVLSLY